jgi:hypothetical protein
MRGYPAFMPVRTIEETAAGADKFSQMQTFNLTHS